MDTSVSTVFRLFQRRVAATPDAVALRVAPEGNYISVTWRQLADYVARAATELIHTLEIEPGDRVATVSENRLEWIVADLAVQSIGAVHVPIHSTLSGSQIVWQITHSGAKCLLLSTGTLAERIADELQTATQRGEIAADLPIVAFHSIPLRVIDRLASRWVFHWNNLLAETVIDEAMLQTRAASIGAQTLATIMYTSGTTGEPKGVMLTHGNLAFNTLAILERFGEQPEDLRLNILPLSHIYARTCDLYTWIARGSQLALTQRRETILDDLQAVRPTLINAVPYFYEWLTRQRELIEQSGKRPVPTLAQMLGGNVRFCFCGGAALPLHVFDAFAAENLIIFCGYGLTETSPVISLSTDDKWKRGTVGTQIPGIELRLTEEGELATHGPHVMQGYWHNEAATQEVLRDGWLYTGDLAEIDVEGFITIAGRKKEIIVTSGGKNIAPSLIEGLLTADPLIAQAVVVGDGRDYLTALIVPDPHNLRAFIRKEWLWVFSKRGALNHPKVRAMYAERIRERLAHLSPHEQIGKFTLMDRGFTPDTGEMTPKLSLRRKLIEQNCREQIEAMYKRSPP